MKIDVEYVLMNEEASGKQQAVAREKETDQQPALGKDRGNDGQPAEMGDKF